ASSIPKELLFINNSVSIKEDYEQNLKNSGDALEMDYQTYRLLVLETSAHFLLQKTQYPQM
ncbi:MAG: hypothetical protein WC629_00205, partial [Candidatus Paceibacterota bacterium]